MKAGRRIFYLILVLAIAVSGCAKEAPQSEEEIVLLDPVNISSGWEMAARRNLYDVKVYSATVIPYTEEYSFPQSVILDRWCAYPGESVKKNGALAYADNSSLEERIEAMEEQIQKTEESFEEYKKQTLESLKEPEEELKRLEQIL